MLYIIAGFSGESHPCPLAFAAAAPQCRLVNEMIGGGFTTRHYSSQLVQRHESHRVVVSEERAFADENVPRAHVLNVKEADAAGEMPKSLAAACWWFERHPQHVPVTLLLTTEALRSLEGVKELSFAPRVHVFYVRSPGDAANPLFLDPLSVLVNLRKVCEFSHCPNTRWMLSCPQLSSVDVIGYDKSVEWNAGDVFPQLPALRELIVYEGNASCLTWLHKCTKLTSIQLDGCSWLTNCDPFADMAELTCLHTKYECLSDISALAGCPKLTKLDFGGSWTLTDVRVIGTLRNLKQLNISGTGVTDLSWIVGCEVLEELVFFGVPLTSGFESLAKLPSLRRVTFFLESSAPLDWITPASRLEELAVSGDVTHTASLDCIRHARFLKRLSLGVVQEIAWLGDCLMLEDLSIGFPVSEVHLIDRLFSLPRLRDLALNLCGPGDHNLTAEETRPVLPARTVAPLVKLSVRAFRVSATVAQTLLECVGRCATLRDLRLSGVPLFADAPMWLEPLTALQTLDIEGCRGSPSLNAIGSLATLRRLSMQGVKKWPGFSGVWKCLRLTSLSVADCPHASDFSALRDGPPMNLLSEVALEKVPLEDLSFLEKASAVQKLRIASLAKLNSIQAVSFCACLSDFTMENCPRVTSLEGLQQCTALTNCEVQRCLFLDDTGALADLARLKALTLRTVTKMEHLTLTGAALIESLSVTKCEALVSIDMPPRGSSLQELRIDACPLLRDCTFISNCLCLREVWLGDLANLDVLPALGPLTRLVEMRLEDLEFLSDLSPLLDCRSSLQKVQLLGCPSVTNASVLTQLPHLNDLHIIDESATDLLWIGDCASLDKLRLTGCRVLRDYSFVLKLKKLSSLLIIECGLDDVSWASQMASPPMGLLYICGCPDLKVEASTSLPKFVRID